MDSGIRERQAGGLFRFMAKLTDPTNWGRWVRAFRSTVESLDLNYWMPIKGKWPRPADPNDAETDASAADFLGKQTAEGTTQSPDSTKREARTLLRNTALGIIDVRAAAARRRITIAWNRRNLALIHDCVSVDLLAPDALTSPEIFELLRQIDDATIDWLKYDKRRQWISLVYNGYNPAEFVEMWEDRLSDYRIIFPSEAHPTWNTCCLIFLNAVNACPEVSPWVNSYTMDCPKREKRDLENLYRVFIDAETRRISMLEQS